MAMAVRLLGVVGAGNWSEFFRVLGRLVSKADDGGDESESVLPLVADESACSPFAVRLRCLCHGMLLPVRAHALRAANKAYGKSEAVPLVRVYPTMECAGMRVRLAKVRRMSWGGEACGKRKEVQMVVQG